MINMTNEVTVLQDELMTETERLAFAATWLRDEMKQVGIETDNMITTNLYIGITNVELDEELLRRQIHRTQEETQRLKERVRGKRNLEKTMTKCEKASYKTEDAVELHSLILFGLKNMAAYVCHVRTLGGDCSEIDEFIQATLSDLYERRLPSGELLELVLTVNSYGIEAMKTFNQAYGSNDGYVAASYGGSVA